MSGEEENLISKKEVLSQTGISYGQLYRWKRKGLIPEEWFIRRSTFTGQETFFPRDKIIPRIEQIKRMKEEHPLDDLAELITRKVDEKLEVAFSRLRDLGWLDERLLGICGIQREEERVPMTDAFCLGIVRRLQRTAREEELELVKRTLEEAGAGELIPRVREEGLQLYLLRKRIAAGGLSAQISAVVIAPAGALFDPELEVIKAVDLRVVLDEIKLGFGASKVRTLRKQLREEAARLKKQELKRLKEEMHKEEG